MFALKLEARGSLIGSRLLVAFLKRRDQGAPHALSPAEQAPPGLDHFLAQQDLSCRHRRDSGGPATACLGRADIGLAFADWDHRGKNPPAPFVRRAVLHCEHGQCLLGFEQFLAGFVGNLLPKMTVLGRDPGVFFPKTEFRCRIGGERQKTPHYDAGAFAVTGGEAAIRQADDFANQT